MTEREALKLALEALDKHDYEMVDHILWKALTQPEQEPVIGTKTWFEDGKVVTQHLTAKDIYKEPEQIPPSAYSNTHQPEHEPVAWMYQDKSTHEVRFQKHMRDFVDHGATYETPLYTTPPQRTWVGLNWDDLPEIYVGDTAFLHGAKWAEAKLREKNSL